MKAQDFVSRKKHSYTLQIEALPVVSYKDIENLNDPKYNWKQYGTEKYNRTMYCSNTGIRRSQTMGEFYGSGIVD